MSHTQSINRPTEAQLARKAIINRIRYRRVQAWAREVPGAHWPALLCWPCSGTDHAHDTPLDYGELCCLMVSEGSDTFPVCDSCGIDLAESLNPHEVAR